MSVVRKTNLLLPCLALVIAILAFAKYAEAAGKYDEIMNFFQDPDKDCKAVVAEMGKKQMSGVSGCTKELNFKNAKEKKERSSCILKCLLKKEQFLAPDGKLNIELIELIKNAEIPPKLASMKDKAIGMFEDCRSKHEAALDDSEVSCKSYGAMIKCLMGMMSLCN